MSGRNETPMFGGEGNTYQPLCGRGDQGVSVYLSSGLQEGLFPHAFPSTAYTEVDNDAVNAVAIPQT